MRHCIPDDDGPLDVYTMLHDPNYNEKMDSRLERKRIVQNFSREQVRGVAEYLIREKIERELVADGVRIEIKSFGMKTVYNDANDQKPIRFSVNASYTRTPCCGCGQLVRTDTVEEAVAEVMKSVDWVLRNISPTQKKERPPEGINQEPVQFDLAL